MNSFKITFFFIAWLHITSVFATSKSKKEISDFSNGFIENKGQFVDSLGENSENVLFKVETKTALVYVTKWGLTYYFLQHNNPSRLKDKNNFLEERQSSKIKWERVDMELLSATIDKRNIRKEGKSMNYSNYYYGHCPEGITKVHAYNKLVIKNIYKGIDWVLYLNENEQQKSGIKYDFIVNPEANLEDIKLKYHGSESMNLILEQKRLSIETRLGSIADEGLVSFSGEQAVDTEFKISDNQAFGFKINERYDTKKPLVIDPALIWSTYYGGNSTDGAYGISSDGTNVFVGGFTTSNFAFFPLNPGGGAYYDGTYGGSGADDAYILKFNTSGVKQWATYYGGSAIDVFYDVHSDGTSLWAVGQTSSANFPTQNPGGGAYFDNALSGTYDACIAKFNATSGALLWSTYYGGTGTESFGSVDYDGTSLWISGSTESADFATQNPGGGAYFDNAIGSTGDAVVLKFTNAGVCQWSTYFGGTTSTESFGTIKSDGTSVWVTGGTNSTNFPTLNPGGGAYFDGTSSTSGDGVIVKFTTAGVLQWSTYYGGDSFDNFTGIYSDGSEVWVTGYTRSSDFSTLNPGGGAYYDGTKTSASFNYDGFILKFNTAGVRQWATYYGGANGTEAMYDIYVDNSFVWVVGTSNSSDFNTMNQTGAYFDNTVSGTDGVIMQFNKSNVLQWSTFVGGTSSDELHTVCSDGTSVWVAGITFSTDYPTQDPGGGAHYDVTLNNIYDIIIMEFDGGSPCGGCTSGGSGSTWTWTGCLGTDWFDPCNWDRQTIPISTSNVIIPNTANKPLINVAGAICNTIEIQSSLGARLDLNSSAGGTLTITQ